MDDDVKLAAIIGLTIVLVVATIGTTWRWIDRADNTSRIECIKAGQTALDCESLLDGVRK